MFLSLPTEIESMDNKYIITFAANCDMHINFKYDKPKVIQALRYHFVSRKEIKVMVILINVFAILSAILLYTKKIRPEPFLLSSLIWVIMAISIWYILPTMVYKKSAAFLDEYTAYISEKGILIKTIRGEIFWPWKGFVKEFETPHHFHVYFDEKQFFLFPKVVMNETELHEFRRLSKAIDN